MSQLAKKEHKNRRKPQDHRKPVSFPEPKSLVVSDENNASESRSSFGKKPMKKKKFLFVNFKGLGCKGTSLPASTPSIIRSAAEWENKNSRSNNQKRRRAPINRRNQANVVVDVPDVCCAPPGIGIASDVVPRTRNATAPRLDHRKQPREARRMEDNSVLDFPAILSRDIGPRPRHRSAAEIIEMLMSQQTQTLLPERILYRHDQYQEWRLNVDDMSYEELLDLSNKIGFVGSGLKEDEIDSCITIFKNSDHASDTLLQDGQKDWKCSICQEKCRGDDDIGRLQCGHQHHVKCIKQWLLHKNSCPLCKSLAMAMPDNSK